MQGFRFLLLAIGLAAVDTLVPYLWLAERPRFAASFLFWCLLTLMVIAGAALHIRHWGRGGDQNGGDEG